MGGGKVGSGVRGFGGEKRGEGRELMQFVWARVKHLPNEQALPVYCPFVRGGH